MLALDESLRELERMDSRSSRLVELRFFGGYTDAEIGEALGISVPTARRDWDFAQAGILPRRPVEHTAQIGRYLVRGEFGRGAMGIVYDAIDPMIGRRVAVKVISLKDGTDPRETEFLKERLFREARSARRLFHPGVVVSWM